MEAHARKDIVELERTARRVGVGRLERALMSPNPPLRAAAIAAAPFLGKAWLLLPSLAGLLGSRDAVQSPSAAEAILRIAEDLRRPDLEHNEDLPETLSDVTDRLAACGRDPGLSPAVRAKALLALAQLMEVVEVGEEALLDLLADPEPVVRQAAIELFAHTSNDEALTRLAGLVVSESAPNVARAAAALICAEVPVSRGRDPARLLALGHARAQNRLRQIAQDPDASEDQLLDVARCLLRIGKPADWKSYRALERRSPLLRRQLRRTMSGRSS